MALWRKLGWQQESLALALGVSVVALLLTVGVGLLNRFLDGSSVFGIPTGFFIQAIAGPLALIAVALWFLLHQAAIDRRHHRID